MSRINTNVSAMIAARNLTSNQASMNTSLQRLSTGLRINSGKDDPAGLIASENLRSEKTAINAAVDNAGRASNMVAVAEGGLQEVNDLLIQLEDLTDRSASTAAMSNEETAANQLQIDSILDSVNRIANTTSFQGKKLLNGDFDYATSGAAVGDQVTAVKINSAKISETAARNVVIDLKTSALTATGLWKTAGLSAAGSLTIQIAGNYGTENITFGGSAKIADMVTAVNQAKELTGVSAVANASGVALNSVGYGKSSFVTVSKVGGTDISLSATISKKGQDAQVTINGTTAITDGLNASVRTSSLSVDLVLSAKFGSGAHASGKQASFDVTGGGANFSLAAEVSLAGRESLGLQSVTTAKLGDANTGFLSTLGSGQSNQLSAKNFGTSQKIIREAIRQVSSLRGRLGSFQKETIQSTINSLKVAYENTAAAESAIRDADFATETSSMTRAQILIQSSTSVLQMANQAPQNVLSLLR